MEPFEAYKIYLALKHHFSSSYDYHKYQGKLRATRAAFEKRNDKLFFFKLAKHRDVEGLLVSTFVQKGDMWIGDLVHNSEVESLYVQWKGVQESFHYTITNDIDALPGIGHSISVEDGQHPVLLQRVLSLKTRIETMIALNDVLRFVPSWNRLIQDIIVWPELRFKCKKYKPFIEIPTRTKQWITQQTTKEK